MIVRTLVMLAMGFVLAAHSALAESYPTRPLRVIVPYTPGSPNDVVARLLVQHLQERLGQPVVIDNKPGGGTTIGSKMAAGATPDGYTLLFSSSALVIEPIMTKNVEYDPLRDFAPIAFVARNSCLLAVNAEVPANSVDELIAYAKAHPGQLRLGFAQGTVSQLVGEYFNRLHGLDIIGVPYKGGALVVPDMLGGRIHIYWPTPATVSSMVRDGKIKVLAVTSPERNPDFPEVPTMKELGKDDLSLEFWGGLWAPAATPIDVITKLNTIVNETLQSPALIESFRKLSFQTRIGSPQDFANFIAAEIPRWTRVVKQSGVNRQ